jgi:alpha/beta superfamily hydrolase
MDHVLAAELAWAAAQAGHPELRFNFRGVGASQGEPANDEEQLLDIQAAARVLEESASTMRLAVVAIGASAAAGLGLTSLHPSLAGLGLFVPANLALTGLARVSVPLLVAVPKESPDVHLLPLSEAVSEAGGLLEVIDGADARFTRGLPQYGRVLVEWLKSLEG